MRSGGTIKSMRRVDGEDVDEGHECVERDRNITFRSHFGSK